MHDRLVIYLFHIFIDGVERKQPLSLAFPSAEHAWREAAAAAHAIIKDMRSEIPGGLEWRMDVRTERGDTIYRFSFKSERL